MTVYVSANVHGGWWVNFVDWFKTTFGTSDLSGATEHFGRSLAQMNVMARAERVYGDNVGLSRTLDAIEGACSDALHALVLKTFGELGVDANTYVAALGVHA